MTKQVLWHEDPLAVHVLRKWLEDKGFRPMQPIEEEEEKVRWQGEPRPEGYFTKSANSLSSRWPTDPRERAMILYRGGTVAKSREKLTAVAEVLDRLSVSYEAANNGYRFPMLIVRISDNL